jgi:hypothetical protein
MCQGNRTNGRVLYTGVRMLIETDLRLARFPSSIQRALGPG